MLDPFAVICLIFTLLPFFLSPLPHMFAGGILARKRSERDLHKERGGQHKGFSRQTNGRLDRSTTATGHTLALTHTHTCTQAPLDQMTALEPGGIALASLSFSPFFPSICTVCPQDKNTVCSMLFYRTHTAASSPAQAGLVCPCLQVRQGPDTVLQTHSRSHNQSP